MQSIYIYQLNCLSDSTNYEFAVVIWDGGKVDFVKMALKLGQKFAPW